jgi:hypothetical protein
MSSALQDPRTLLLLAALAIAALALLGWWRSLGRGRRIRARRQRIARVGEEEAERLLEKHGFVVMERQVTGWWTMWVDGVERQVSCRADLLVRPRNDRSRRLVAEVKTGVRATDPTFPQTRRQLLEYSLAFEVDGVLLLDMERYEVHEIEF